MAGSEWTEELKQEVVDAYLKLNPTPENTMELVKDLAEDYEKTPNGIRMILTKANAYVKKVPTPAAGKATKAAGEGSKRVNKSEAIDGLKKTIGDLGQDVDDSICDKLTGKAAVYFTEILSKMAVAGS